jgi:hypothetical protein
MFEAVVLDKLYIWTASRQPEAVENSVGTIIMSTASTSNKLLTRSRVVNQYGQW